MIDALYREMLPSLPHCCGAGSPQVPGPPAPSTPCPQASCGVSGAAVPTGQGERVADSGGNTCEEHTAGINHAGKIPKRVGVASGVPALAGIQQHRPILTEYTKLHLDQFPI